MIGCLFLSELVILVALKMGVFVSTNIRIIFVIGLHLI